MSISTYANPSSSFEDEDEFLPEPQAIVYTFSGRLDKRKLSMLCMDIFFKHIILDFDIPTLLDIYDEFDKEESADHIVHGTSGVTFYPVRVQVLKTLFLFPNEDTLLFMAINREHKALKMMLEAGQREMNHLPVPETRPSPSPCKCKASESAMNVLTCVYCESVVCHLCSKYPCVFTLQEVINDMEPEDEDEEDEEISDEEDGEEMDIDY